MSTWFCFGHQSCCVKSRKRIQLARHLWLMIESFEYIRGPWILNENHGDLHSPWNGTSFAICFGNPFRVLNKRIMILDSGSNNEETMIESRVLFSSILIIFPFLMTSIECITKLFGHKNWLFLIWGMTRVIWTQSNECERREESD